MTAAPVALLIATLLETLDTVEQAARHIHPTQLDAVLPMLDARGALLRDGLAQCGAADWPEALAPLREDLGQAVQAAQRACDGMRAAADASDLRQVYRALRQAPRAMEALYPTAAVLPSVSGWFLEPDSRDDAALLQRLSRGATRSAVPTGVAHFANAGNERGGFSLYVPEDYDPAQSYPLVMALHGGAGHGRWFLWSWLRTARSRGAILVAPTAIGDTWSLMQPDIDATHLAQVLAQVASRYSLDPRRLLLTGMSDGGTFTLLSGLDADSPFTHLAPVAASFHPLLLTMAEPRRLTGLPIYLVHGALDWMFPVSVARAAQHALTAAGAHVEYREIADLSHTYPRDENARMLDWLAV